MSEQNLASLLRSAAMAQGRSYRDVADSIGADEEDVQRLFTEGPSEDDMRAFGARLYRGQSEAAIRRDARATLAQIHPELSPEDAEEVIDYHVAGILEAGVAEPGEDCIVL